MALSEIDRNLLDDCLARRPRSWEGFVDRFVGLVIHVINHTAQSRAIQLTPEDRDDLAADVFLAIVQNDLAVLRRFRRQSSLATYLTVVSRRIVVKELLRRKAPSSLGMLAEQSLPDRVTDSVPEQRLSDREEVARLLEGLNASEERIVRKYHLEGKSYREISDETGVPENSIGPALNRARGKMRGQGGQVTK
ncbi:MAG: RNA polymerase subunit sigma-70 [Planctomycetaceae bacterium]|nr:RNA polymerase subunit sigma-70 [Planctomycetaceae bacterium]